jgi:hypothetical protein
MNHQPGTPGPHEILGVPATASDTEITAAYRRLVRAYHPDGPRPDAHRFADVLRAYRLLRSRDHRQDTPPPQRGTAIPVHHTHSTAHPDLHAGPVRYHPRQTPQR